MFTERELGEKMNKQIAPGMHPNQSHRAPEVTVMRHCLSLWCRVLYDQFDYLLCTRMSNQSTILGVLVIFLW